MKRYHYLILLFAILLYCLKIEIGAGNGISVQVKPTERLTTKIVFVKSVIENTTKRVAYFMIEKSATLIREYIIAE